MNKLGWADYLEIKEREFGREFVPPVNADLLSEYVNSGIRLEVDADGCIERGFIGLTTGWRPCFILLRTKRSSGSGICLDGNVKILRILNY